MKNLIVTVACAGLASCAFTQGSAGGYGQGGGGMGGGGVSGGRMGFSNSFNRQQEASPLDKAARPDEDEAYNLWTTKTAILTPSDRVEFKLKMRKGETLLASATSDAFDPALSIEDSKGAVLAKNDDRSEGDQSPFLVYRFAEPGDYVLKVLSFRSIAGGKFTLKTRSFIAVDAQLGKTKYEKVPLSGPDNNGPVDFRLRAAKGQVFELGEIRDSARSGFYHSIHRLIGPSGVETQDYIVLPDPGGVPVFKALADGDYYVESDSYGQKNFETNFKAVTLNKISTTDEKAINFGKNELQVFEFQVKPEQIVETRLSGSVSQLMSAIDGNVARPIGQSDSGVGNTREWIWFRLNRDSDDDVVRVFHRDASVCLLVRSPSEQKLTLKNSEKLDDWRAGSALRDQIKIGDARLYLIQSSKSELMRLAASASHFEPKLEIFRLNGELANSLMDRRTHHAGDDLYFPDAGTFIVRFSCDGNGGSGDYEMKRQSIPAEPYKLGTAKNLNLDGVNFGLYEVNLEAGKRYQVTIDNPDSWIRTDLLDEDGEFLVSTGVTFDKVEVQYFVPKRSGRHRLWLRGAPANHKFKFDIHVPPVVG